MDFLPIPIDIKCYNSLLKREPSANWPYHLYWNLSYLPKARAFIWLTLRDIILTGTRLDKMGITSLYKCVLCDKAFESSDHSLLHCEFAQTIWKWLQEGSIVVHLTSTPPKLAHYV